MTTKERADLRDLAITLLALYALFFLSGCTMSEEEIAYAKRGCFVTGFNAERVTDSNGNTTAINCVPIVIHEPKHLPISRPSSRTK